VTARLQTSGKSHDGDHRVWLTLGETSGSHAAGTFPFVSLGRMHSKTNGCLRVFSQLGMGHEPAGRSVDPADDDRVCGLAGADRRTVSFTCTCWSSCMASRCGWRR
jgi:hypothetical protein